MEDRIIQLARNIILAVSEGKTVTAANKRIIKEAADDIITTCQNTPATVTAHTCQSTFPEEAINQLKKELIQEIHTTIKNTLKHPNSVAQPSTTTNVSYSSIARAQFPQKPALIINAPTRESASSSTANNQSTIEQLKNQITFKDKTYAPSKIQPITKGRVYLEFNNTQQQKETQQLINQTSNLKAEEARRRPPLAILKGIYKETNKEELTKIICQQNSIPTTAIRLCFLTSNRSEKLYNAVIELTPTAYQKIIQQNRVAVNFQQVHIEPFSRFTQCRKCLQFGHSHNKCTSTVHPCAICADENHQAAECPHKSNKQFVCYNCTKYNSKTGAKLPTNHAANNQAACPRIRLAKTKIEETVDYGTTLPTSQPSSGSVDFRQPPFNI